MPERRVHDCRQRYWGHDYTLAPNPDPVTARITGWGDGLREGDLLLISRQGGGACLYEIETLRWADGVSDMWFTTSRFVPASSQLGQRAMAAIEHPQARPPLPFEPGWWVLDD